MNVLEKICDEKRGIVAKRQQSISLEDIKKQAQAAPAPLGFIEALQAKPQSLITEIKKASPSKGIIREDFDPVKIAQIYKENGASCLSVLTDENYFMGSDAIFKAVREVSPLPLLRKDFMVDAYQIYESRALGADCILIIMAALNDAEAKAFYEIATDLGMDSLFEVHDQEELERALTLSPKMVGVNNRNLKTLEVSLDTSMALAEHIPDSVHKVSESGIYTKEDMTRLSAAGYASFLIGESLMREEDMAAALQRLVG